MQTQVVKRSPWASKGPLSALAGQGLQRDCPSWSWYVECTHLSQSVISGERNLPAAHGTHERAPAAAYMPPAQL